MTRVMIENLLRCNDEDTQCCGVVVGAVAGVPIARERFAQRQTAPRVGFVAGAGGYPKMAVTNQAFSMGCRTPATKMGARWPSSSVRPKAT